MHITATDQKICQYLISTMLLKLCELNKVEYVEPNNVFIFLYYVFWYTKQDTGKIIFSRKYLFKNMFAVSGESQIEKREYNTTAVTFYPKLGKFTKVVE